MKIKKILLLSGGPSRERKVSISSGKAVYYALRQLKYNVVRVDPSPQYSNFKNIIVTLHLMLYTDNLEKMV